MRRALMAAWLACSIVAAGLALSHLTLAAAQTETQTISGIASVVDGDTIEIHGERIRLGGFDAPENGASCGAVNVYNRAAHALSDYIASRTVHCSVTGRDAYGRTTANCSVGGVDLGDHMVSAGWARDWPRYSQGRYGRAEAEARAQGAGIWGMDCPANLWGNRDYAAGALEETARPLANALSQRMFVTASTLNVRAGAGGDHPIIGRVQRGAGVTIIERSEGWARLAPGAGQNGGWVSSQYLGDAEPTADVVSDGQIRRMIMEQSLAYYAGSCPCPYNVDRAGRRCGRRSAYSRPGGASPMCYPSDVSDAQVQAFRSRAH